jgi:hypothetical protein
MPATHSFQFDAETIEHLDALTNQRAVSAAQVVRDLINEAFERANPPLAVGFFALDVRGDVDEPICAQCEQIIERDRKMFAALMSNDTIIAPLCESCANTD